MEKRKFYPAIGYSPNPHYYLPSSSSYWAGRVDGAEAEHQRWHQKMRLIDLNSTEAEALAEQDVQVDLGELKPASQPIVLLGFACDEGIRRNMGRVGAADGPAAIRKALCNLPIHEARLSLWDAGDITCTDGQLEIAQGELAQTISACLHAKVFPIVLGGGHEVTYGHYKGLRSYLDEQNSKKETNSLIGIINFDAHFDNRQPGPSGPSSGTGFWQIEQEESTNFRYLALGIQRSGNTKALFERAISSGTQYILAEDVQSESTISQVQNFCRQVDQLYITIDLDVFATAYAPGVSAPSAWGLSPDAYFLRILKTILRTGKTRSMDLAELNPSLDIDQRTAKLAAILIDQVVTELTGNH